MASLTWNPGINNSNPYVILTVTEKSQSISDNYTILEYSLKLYRPYNISSTAPKDYNVKINGITVASGTTYIGGSGTKTIASGTTAVYHNNDGTKNNVAISFYQEIAITWSGRSTGNASRSGTINLTSIPRYARITSYSVSDLTCIGFKLNYAVDKSISEVQYSVNNGTWYVMPGNRIFSASPGTTYKVKISVKASDSGLWTTSGDLSISTPPLSSISSAVDFNLESNLAVNISKGNNNLVHDIWLEAYYDGAWWDVSKNTLANINTSATLIPTPGAVTTLQNKHPDTKNVRIKIRMVCKWNGVTQGTVFKEGVARIVNADPTLASVAYKDVSTLTVPLLANNQKILRNKSSLRVIAGAAVSQKGAKLKTYRVTLSGNNYTTTAAANATSETGKEVSIGLVDQSANQTAIITVTDSRGNTAHKSFTVEMLDYQAPQIIQAMPQRLNDYEASTTMLVEGRRYQVKPVTADVNEVYLRYRLKENPSGAYGSWVTLSKTDGSLSGLWRAIAVSQYMADYPNDKSYTVELQISDKFTTWTSVLLEITEGIAIMRLLKDKIITGVQLEILSDKGLILNASNGTKFKVTVSNGGVLSTSIA